MKKVMVFGTFDGIHKGHEFLFEEAKKHGDFLIVVVARDKTVLEIKKRLPRRDEKTRLLDLRNLSIVDEAVLGNDEDKLKIVLQKKPDIVCLGYDQKSFVDQLKERISIDKLPIEIIRLGSFMPDVYKSSKLDK
jgi:cytidyltransferase-like protein